MTVRDHLKAILDGYVQARQRQPFPGDFRGTFDRLTGALSLLPSVKDSRGVKVRAHFGLAQWSRSPLVYLVLPGASGSSRSGESVCLRFRQDMAGFCLYLAVGGNREITTLGRAPAHASWRRWVEELRGFAGALPAQGFHLDDEIDLGLDDARIAEDIQAATVAWTYHPATSLPDDETLDGEIAELLAVYRKWLDTRQPERPEPFDAAALTAMRQSFQRHMSDFGSFTEPGSVYPEEERLYKDELAAAFRAEVQPLFSTPPSEIEPARKAIAALHDLLTRRKLESSGSVQNLVNWRTTEHLRKLSDEETLEAARLYSALLVGEGESPDRVEDFSIGYLPILARSMKSGLQGVTRSLPTLLLMLADPEHEIFVRTNLFNDTAKLLTGHRLLTPEPLNAADYAACLDFAGRIRRALEDWGWQPRDLIDVQSFLWVAGSAASAEDLAFLDALDAESERRIFKIAPGPGAKHWDECLEGGFMCVGWDEVGDLRDFAAEDEDRFVEIFRQAHEDQYTGSSGKLSTGTRKARELWQLRDIQAGDIVLANRGISEVLAMGEVVEPGYEFDLDRESFRHMVRVRWDTSMQRDLRAVLSSTVKTAWSNNTVVPVERELYAAILEGRPFETHESVTPRPDPPTYRKLSFPEIVTSIEKSGLKLSERMIRRYHAAVAARGFVILAGTSGTGKTWLAEAYADAVGAHALTVRVAPNWNSNEDLLGFVSPLNGDYQHTAFSNFLVEADKAFRRSSSAAAVRPCHVLLDEMNLARVEHYFADFLSALEQRQRYGEVTLTLGGQEVTIHRNLVFVGTVNMDETTHGFAHKVYDRAQLIEVELDPELFALHLAGREYATDLTEIRSAVEEVAPIAFRTADDIADYINTAIAVEAPWQEAFDEASLQKVLPRIRGIEPRVGETLSRLVEITQGRYPLSHRKARRMLEDFRLGVASFF